MYVSILEDYDHCQMNNCHRNAKCTNAKYTFSCHCLQGYHGDGVQCDVTKSIDKGGESSGAQTNDAGMLHFTKNSWA